MLFEMLLGHLVGDYLLQNKWMALSKNKHNGLGGIACVVHCVLYTFAVCLIMWEWDINWAVAVFMSHYFIDRYGLAEKYLNAIGGRTLESFIIDVENREHTPVVVLRGGFTIIVYTITDNTMHLLLMYLAWRLLFAGGNLC